MATKLTLTLNDKIIENAKKYSKKNKISLSKLVENYFKNITVDSSKENSDDLPPITKELSGIAKFDDHGMSYKEMLTEALTKKYLNE